MTDFGNIRGKWLKVMLFMSIDAEGTTFIEKKKDFVMIVKLWQIWLVSSIFLKCLVSKIGGIIEQEKLFEHRKMHSDRLLPRGSNHFG